MVTLCTYPSDKIERNMEQYSLTLRELEHILFSQKFVLLCPSYYRISSDIRQSFFFPKQCQICKTDLDLWDCSGRVKLILKQNFIGLI